MNTRIKRNRLQIQYSQGILVRKDEIESLRCNSLTAAQRIVARRGSYVKSARFRDRDGVLRNAINGLAL